MLTAVKDSEDKVDVTGPSHQHLLVEKERVVSTFSHLELTKDQREVEESKQAK